MCKKISVQCPKCLGRKSFREFSNIAGGVCFMCGGNGTIEVTDHPVKPAKVSDETHRKATYIMQATVEQIAKLNWRQISEARDFAHSHPATYPALNGVWNDRFEDRFQEMQCAKRDEWMAANAR